MIMGHLRTRFLPQTRNIPLLHNLITHPNKRPNLPQTLKMESKKPKRPTCPSCCKPTVVCLCSRIRRLENPVSVTILQHSLETKHALNSTRIARLGLNNLTITTVFDVRIAARFEIRPLGSDSEMPNGAECVKTHQLGLNGVGELNSERANAKKLKFETNGMCPDEKNNDFIDVVDKDCSCLEDLESSGELGSNWTKSQELVLNAKPESDSAYKMVQSGFESKLELPTEALINISTAKKGVITKISPSSIKNLSFETMFASEDTINAFSKGFVAKKFIKEDTSTSIEFEEYEIKIHPGSVLLFPSEEAMSITDLETKGLEVKNLIVLDGTWAKAKRMYVENPWLKLLPHLRLDLDVKSLYSEVRRQPKAGFLSTIESVVFAMKAVGKGPEGLDNLLDAFESMVKDQRRCKDERLIKADQP